MSVDDTFSNVFDTLVDDDSSYSELVSVYQSLRKTDSRDVEVTVARWALVSVVGDVLDYLDFVGEELEKSVGITRDAELERILETLERPVGSTPTEQVYDFVQQWESVKLYTFEDVYPPETVDARESLEQRI